MSEPEPFRIFRPRFSHLVVHTLSDGNYKRFSPPISSKEVAAYIGISVETFIQSLSASAPRRGELEFLITTPGGSENRVRVYYERKVTVQ